MNTTVTKKSLNLTWDNVLTYPFETEDDRKAAIYQFIDKTLYVKRSPDLSNFSSSIKNYDKKQNYLFQQLFKLRYQTEKSLPIIIQDNLAILLDKIFKTPSVRKDTSQIICRNLLDTHLKQFQELEFVKSPIFQDVHQYDKDTQSLLYSSVEKVFENYHKQKSLETDFDKVLKSYQNLKDSSVLNDDILFKNFLNFFIDSRSFRKHNFDYVSKEYISQENTDKFLKLFDLFPSPSYQMLKNLDDVIKHDYVSGGYCQQEAFMVFPENAKIFNYFVKNKYSFIETLFLYGRLKPSLDFVKDEKRTSNEKALLFSFMEYFKANKNLIENFKQSELIHFFSYYEHKDQDFKKLTMSLYKETEQEEFGRLGLEIIRGLMKNKNFIPEKHSTFQIKDYLHSAFQYGLPTLYTENFNNHPLMEFIEIMNNNEPTKKDIILKEASIFLSNNIFYNSVHRPNPVVAIQDLVNHPVYSKLFQEENFIQYFNEALKTNYVFKASSKDKFDYKTLPAISVQNIDFLIEKKWITPDVLAQNFIIKEYGIRILKDNWNQYAKTVIEEQISIQNIVAANDINSKTIYDEYFALCSALNYPAQEKFKARLKNFMIRKDIPFPNPYSNGNFDYLLKKYPHGIQYNTEDSGEILDQYCKKILKSTVNSEEFFNQINFLDRIWNTLQFESKDTYRYHNFLKQYVELVINTDRTGIQDKTKLIENMMNKGLYLKLDDPNLVEKMNQVLPLKPALKAKLEQMNTEKVFKGKKFQKEVKKPIL